MQKNEVEAKVVAKDEILMLDAQGRHEESSFC